MPLRGLRVVEIGEIPGGAYAARLFADFEADVLKIEQPGGDALRARAPKIEIGGGESEGCWFAYLNANKRSLTLDPSVEAHRGRLAALLAEADVLIDSLSPEQRLAWRIDHADLAADNPNLLVLSMSWFGESGPYKDFAATELVCRALSGMAYLVGPKEGPPTPLPDYQADVVAGLNGFSTLLAAVHARADLGGRRFELSVMEACIQLAEYNVALDWAADRRDHRWGVNRFWPNYPLGIYRCKEGWIGVTIVTFAQWASFCRLLRMENLTHHPDYAINRGRIVAAETLEARFTPVFLEKTAQEWFEIALEERLPFVVVPTIGELLETPEFRRRNAFIPAERGEVAFEAPASPLRLTRTPPKATARIPAPGDETASWRSRGGDVAALSGAAVGRERSLEGLQVVDLSMGWAGPSATRILGDLGADIVKVEACQYPDWWRGVDNRPIVMEQRLYEKSGYFNVMNRNKRGVTLDLTSKEGVDLVKRLVAKADLVVENYSAGVLPKLGLDYEALRKVNPSIIMISMPAFAADGPWRELRAYGSTLEHSAAIPSVSGRAGDPPCGNHIAYGDPISGVNAAAALMVALLHRNRTGEGQKIDFSQVECSLPMIAPWIIEQSATGSVTPRMGTRHPAYAPHGCFPCDGEDDWVLLSVETAEHWRGLCSVIGREDWAADPALATLQGRREIEDEIEATVADWTRRLPAQQAMEVLQAAGVPAGVARRPIDLLEDPHLAARGFWQMVEREYSGPQPNPSPTAREAAGPDPIRRAAPTLGQHNAEVLREKLGLSDQELAALEQSGVIGQEAVPPHLRKARAAVGARPPEQQDKAG